MVVVLLGWVGLGCAGLSCSQMVDVWSWMSVLSRPSPGASRAFGAALVSRLGL